MKNCRCSVNALSSHARANRPARCPALLHNLGAEVIELPTIEIQPAADYAALDNAIANLRDYDWLIFTSANGVRFFLERLDASNSDLRAIQGRICAIGPATRDALERFHLKVDVHGRTSMSPKDCSKPWRLTI